VDLLTPLIWLSGIAVIVGFVYLRHRDHTPKMYRTPLPPEPPRAPSGPMGPIPPAGIQAPPPRPATTKHPFGPNFLTGKLKELSEEALVEVHRFAVLPAEPGPIAEMAADYMAAVRWWRVGVDPNAPDNYLFNAASSRRIETIIDAYRSLPPSRDRDQALQILGYYLPMSKVEGRDKAPTLATIAACKAWIAKGNPPEKWNEFYDTSV
jgi:hypothetical protein